jgi:uncharacterized protein
MSYFLCVIGMVFIVEAVPYILSPRKVKTFAQFVSAVPEGTMQIVGIFAACIGIAVIHVGRHLGGM